MQSLKGSSVHASSCKKDHPSGKWTGVMERGSVSMVNGLRDVHLCGGSGGGLNAEMLCVQPKNKKQGGDGVTNDASGYWLGVAHLRCKAFAFWMKPQGHLTTTPTARVVFRMGACVHVG